MSKGRMRKDEYPLLKFLYLQYTGLPTKDETSETFTPFSGFQGFFQMKTGTISFLIHFVNHQIT